MTSTDLLTQTERKRIVQLIEKGLPLPETLLPKLFPDENKKCELRYANKIRKEDLLSNLDGSTAVPLQVDRVFNGTEHPPFDDGWRNLLVFGDNLQFLKTIHEDEDSLIKGRVKGKVKLIYIDPPFATEDEFSTKAGAKAYSDKVKGTEFLESLRRRLILAKEILASDGSLFLHIDQKMGHYVKVLMDEIFGKNCFVNEIVWHFRTYQGQVKSHFPQKHNVIFWYRRSGGEDFQLTYSDEDIESSVDFKRWKSFVVNGDEIRGGKYPASDSRFMAYYEKFVKEHGRRPTKDDVILRLKGYVIDDVWTDIPAIDPKDKDEKTGYPTQKPELLLKRIIESTTKEGDLVLDFFSGSGTTLAVAEKLNRRWIGCDIGKYSFFSMQQRLLTIQDSKSLNPSAEGQYGRYEKKARSFITAQLGIYDLEKALSLDWPDYKRFAAMLFDFKLAPKKIGGVEFDGDKGESPVKIFDYNSFKGCLIDESYLADLHKHVGKKTNGVVFIVSPITSIGFFSDYHEIGDVRYYFLKIPYHVIKELTKVPFKRSPQPDAAGKVNSLEYAIGFHFITPPKVSSYASLVGKSLEINVESFESSDPAAPTEGFNSLASIFMDRDFKGQFMLTDVFFRDSLASSATGLKASLSANNVGKLVKVIYIDIFGNETSEIIDTEKLK
jgi:DNA modification methylase